MECRPDRCALSRDLLAAAIITHWSDGPTLALGLPRHAAVVWPSCLLAAVCQRRELPESLYRRVYVREVFVGCGFCVIGVNTVSVCCVMQRSFCD